MSEQRSFRVLRSFLAVIVMAIPTVTGVAAFVTTNVFRDEFFDEAKVYATQVALNVFSRVEREFLAPKVRSGTPIDLVSQPEQLAELRGIVESATFGHGVERLYFFDREGLIIFSTVEEHIYEQMPPGNPHFQSALHGETASVVRRRDNPLDISEDPTSGELLETYVPVRSSDSGPDGPVVGVVEIYQDIRDLNRAVEASTLRVITVALASMGILGGLFALITLRADREIQRRGSELIESNRALQELSRHLEQQVEERTRQLIHKEKLASLGTLAAGVAHEINNPLATISTCAEGSLRRTEVDQIAPDELPIVRRYLGLIRDEVYRCKRITRNLLDFSRQTVGVATEAVDVNALVQQTLDLVQLGPEAAGVELRTSLLGDSGGVIGDASELRQVIHNLVVNALSAVAPSDRKEVLLRTSSTRSAFVLECLDSGAGVPVADRTKVFEPFFTTKGTGEGTGLGLAVCYAIAERHGGHIEVADSAPEQRLGGACFRVVLPRKAPNGGAAGAVDSDENRKESK